YSYSWFPSGGNAASASGLASGDYIITVTDANGCIMADTVTVGSTGGLQLTLASASMVKCFGGSDGSASVNATSGTPPYQYAWSPGGGTTNTLNGLSAGNYSVQVTDVSGCTVTLPVSITQPDVLQAATSTTAVSCFGASTGAATVTVTGGTSPYTYLWNPGNATTTGISNRPAGNYTVTITDANACTTTSAASITQPPVINLNMQSTPVSCNATNGTATVIPSGGSGAFTFSWFPSNDTTATADSLAPGTYVVVVTDGNGCTRSGNVTVNALPVPHVQVDSSRSVTCNGDTNGAVFCSVSGGAAPFNYQWTGTAGTGSSLTNIGAGIYQLLVIDANGCRDSVLAQVQEPSPLAILLTTENVLCAGAASGRIFAEVGGGVPPYSYNWTPGGQVNDTAVGLTGGTYQVFVTDSNGCTTQGSAAITEPAAIQATVTGVDALCATNCDGHGEVTIAGGVEPYFVTWCNGDTTRQVNNLCGGDCQVLITDGNGCGISQTISLQQPDTLQLTVAHTNPSCQGCADGTASVDVSGGLPPYAYDWSPVTGTADSISALVAGWYVVCVTDSGGCSRCDSVEVLDGPVGLEEVAFQSGLYVYPNPFTDATTFLFSLAVTQDVRLEIFDMTGQLVSVVARDRLAAGVHRFRWESPQLAPGLYQFRFLNGQRSQAGTLVIQR
ncbi:MAG: T9SS type A sorting domain-containing protein, partial [Bacteroidota bacterium]